MTDIWFNSIDIDVSTYATLDCKSARIEWEKNFDNIYIEPILSVSTTYNQILNYVNFA